jgi:hypothetical protein
MAQQFQFYKGEDFKIRILPESSEITIDANTKCALLVFPSNIDFNDMSDGNKARVKVPATYFMDGKIEFTIPFYETMNMELGDYTVEFIVGDGSTYGTDSTGSRNIFRYDNLFTVVDGGPVIKSGYEIITPENA